jgi:Mlc titration factor MtfA (ptsG expression regulator)
LASEYGQAQQIEDPVSDYGTNNPAEDFAEACEMYTTDSEILQEKFPAKFAALDKLLGESTKYIGVVSKHEQKPFKD